VVIIASSTNLRAALLPRMAWVTRRITIGWRWGQLRCGNEPAAPTEPEKPPASQAVVTVSGGEANSPFTTPDQVCATGLPRSHWLYTEKGSVLPHRRCNTVDDTTAHSSPTAPHWSRTPRWPGVHGCSTWCTSQSRTRRRRSTHPPQGLPQL